MNQADERFLLTLANHHDDVEAGIQVWKEAEEQGWAIVYPAFRESADRLVALGLAEKHPNSKRVRWYRITEAGLAHVEQVRYDIGQGKFDHEYPTWVNAAIAAYRRRYKDPQAGDYRLIRELIMLEARQSYETLARQMAADGYVYIPEPGRYPENFVVAFYSPFSGRFKLYCYRTYGIVTEWREVRYLAPGRPHPDLIDEELPEIPI